MLDLDLALTLLSTISLCQIQIQIQHLPCYPLFLYVSQHLVGIQYFHLLVLNISLCQMFAQHSIHLHLPGIQKQKIYNICTYPLFSIISISLYFTFIPSTPLLYHLPTHINILTTTHTKKKLTYYGNSYLHTILSLFHYIIIPSIPISTLFIYYLTQLSLSFPIILPTHLSTTILPYSIHIYTTPITILPYHTLILYLQRHISIYPMKVYYISILYFPYHTYSPSYTYLYSLLLLYTSLTYIQPPPVYRILIYTDIHTHTHTDIHTHIDRHIHTQTDTYTTHSYEKIIHLFIYISITYYFTYIPNTLPKQTKQ